MPQALTLNLGQLSFWSSHDPLRLSSHPSLVISDLEPNTISHDIDFDARSLEHGAAWMKRGAGLRLSINLEGEGFELDDSAKETFVEKVGAVLKNAEIWSQLLLDVSLSILAIDNRTISRIGTIVLSIAHQNIPFETRSAFLKDRKLLSANVEPPPRLFSGSLREINVQLLFSMVAPKSLFSFKRQKNNSTIGVSGNAPEKGDLDEMLDNVHEDHVTTYSQGFDGSSSNAEQHSSPQGLTDVNGARSVSELIEDEYTLDLLDSQIVVVENTSIEEDTRSDVTFPPASLKKNTASRDAGLIESAHAIEGSPQSANQAKKRSAKQDQTESTSLDLGTSVTLLDAAIRRLICGNDLRLGTGIKQSQPVETPPLSEISPVLFSPGYLPAIAQRSQLLGRIASSIASIYERSKSANFRASLIKIVDPCTIRVDDSSQLELEDHSELAKPIDKVVLSSALQSRLWTLMQLSLFDRGATRKLKPLTTSMDVTQGSTHLQVDMLDRTQPSNLLAAGTQSSSSSSSQTDADLFSDEDDSANRSLLDEHEILELVIKDKNGFSDLFNSFDRLDEEDDWDPFYEDELLEEHDINQEIDMTLL